VGKPRIAAHRCKSPRIPGKGRRADSSQRRDTLLQSFTRDAWQSSRVAALPVVRRRIWRTGVA